MLQLTMWYLLNVYMCEKVHVRACMQCWREFAKCRFTHFPSFFSVHVDTYVCGTTRRRQASGRVSGCVRLNKWFYLVKNNVNDGNEISWVSCHVQWQHQSSYIFMATCLRHNTKSTLFITLKAGGQTQSPVPSLITIGHHFVAHLTFHSLKFTPNKSLNL